MEQNPKITQILNAFDKEVSVLKKNLFLKLQSLQKSGLLQDLGNPSELFRDDIDIFLFTLPDTDKHFMDNIDNWDKSDAKLEQYTNNTHELRININY